MSMLRKYVLDQRHVFYDDEVVVEGNIQVVTEPAEIIHRRDQQLRNKMILLVRVSWRNRAFEEDTWELES